MADFEELVRRFQVPLLQFLQNRTSVSDAEDLLQDTLIRAYQNLHRYNASWRFRTWLYTIARRLSINHYRRRQMVECEDPDSVQSALPSPAAAAAEEDSRRRLWDRAAGVLTEPQMTAVWLYYVDDMSVKEIATVQGRSRVAVKTMLFRARQKLQPILKDLEPGGRKNNHNTTLNHTSCHQAVEVPHG